VGEFQGSSISYIVKEKVPRGVLGGGLQACGERRARVTSEESLNQDTWGDILGFIFLGLIAYFGYAWRMRWMGKELCFVVA
jgi:hypothetical protein